MDAILFVLRTGCQWNALNATGICSRSSAHRRFLEWTEAGVFLAFWREGVLAYDELKGLDWSWLALDGVMVKAPWPVQKTGRNSTDRGQHGMKRSRLTAASRVPVGLVGAGAHRHDLKLARPTLASLAVPRPNPTAEHPQTLGLDTA